MTYVWCKVFELAGYLYVKFLRLLFSLLKTIYRTLRNGGSSERTAFSGSYGCDSHEAQDDFQSFNSWSSEEEEDDNDFWSSDSVNNEEDSDTRQQFDQMDAAATDWGSQDINNIIW